MVEVNMTTSFSSYSLCDPTCRPPISVRHLRVTFLKSATLKNLVTRVSMMFVSKMYPRGIQLRKRNKVSRVALTKLGLSAICKTSEHSWNMEENSAHMLFLRSRVFFCVICSAEKSKTSSDSSRRITMLFSQMDRFVRHELTISSIKAGQS